MKFGLFAINYGTCADPEHAVLLPQPDADREHRHRPVPVDRILQNIDSVAEQFIHS